MARLHALLGAEPVPGALANLFSGFGAREEALKRWALQLARGTLSRSPDHANGIARHQPPGDTLERAGPFVGCTSCVGRGFKLAIARARLNAG